MAVITDPKLAERLWKDMCARDTTLEHRIKTELLPFWKRNDDRSRRRRRRKARLK